MEPLIRGDGVNDTKPYTEKRTVQSCFADFTLDPLAGTLVRGGAEIALRSKSFEVLVYLVNHHGSLVEREELFREAWAGLEVTDESVTRCIADIRKALGDEAQKIIRTVPRRGYMFTAAVTTAIVELPQPRGAGPEKVPIPAPSEKPRAQRKWIWAALVFVLLILDIVAWRTRRDGETLQPQRAVPLTTLPGVTRYPAFSPEGDRVVFTWTGAREERASVYVQQIGAGPPVRLTTSSTTDYNPVWSPDGRWIAYLRRHSEDNSVSEVRLVPPLGGPERKLTDIRVPNTYFLIPPYLTWCPDSTCVVVSDSLGNGNPAGLFLVSLDTGEKTQLTAPVPTTTGDTNPAVSPTGNWLVFRRQNNGSRIGALYRLSIRTGFTPAGDPQEFTPPAMDAGYPTWTPDGKEVLFSTEASEVKGNLWRVSASAERPGEPTRLPFIGEDGMMPVVSRPQPGRASRMIYVFSFRDSNIWRVETSGPGVATSTPATLAISSSRGDSTPQLSPDGRRIAFISDRSGAWEIWVSDLDGSNAIQLTSLLTDSGAPTWSPDGGRIAFQAASGTDRDVFMMSASGGKPRKLISGMGNASRPSFSRDGKWIYFSSTRGGQRQIWKMPVSGGDAIQVTSNGAFAAFESPDGRFLYYNQSMDVPSPLWRVPTSGGAPAKVLDGVSLGAFAVIERGIYYIERPAGAGGVLYIDRPSTATRLQYFDEATHQTTTVARNLGNVFLGLTASKDGRTIFFSRIDSSLDDLMLVERFR
jgi:eukaryotic-like serine/threonine-protein kinase